MSSYCALVFRGGVEEELIWDFDFPGIRNALLVQRVFPLTAKEDALLGYRQVSPKKVLPSSTPTHSILERFSCVLQRTLPTHPAHDQLEKIETPVFEWDGVGSIKMEHPKDIPSHGNSQGYTIPWDKISPLSFPLLVNDSTHSILRTKLSDY